MSRDAAVLALLAVLAAASVRAANHGHAHPAPYSAGAAVPVQCRDDDTRTWGSAPVCSETGKPLAFSFGMQTYTKCTVDVDAALFQRLVRYTLGNETWQCRVPLGVNGDAYLPLPVPVWGQMNNGALLVNAHMNFLFHAERNYVIGAGAYAVRDNFQRLAPDGANALFIRGPARWLDRQSFTALPEPAVADPAKAAVGSVFFRPLADKLAATFTVARLRTILVALFSGLLFTAALVQLYRRVLAPRVVREHLKEE